MKEEKNLVLEQDPEVLETVEFTILPPSAGTLVSCSDPEGFDQTPVPEVISHSDAPTTPWNTIRIFDLKQAIPIPSSAGSRRHRVMSSTILSR